MKTKDLYKKTYANNIGYENIPNIKYKGLRLIPSNSAMREMIKLGITIEDCKYILENGYSVKKRAKNTEERWFSKRKKIFNVVVIKSINYFFNEEVFLMSHVGIFTKNNMRSEK